MPCLQLFNYKGFLWINSYGYHIMLNFPAYFKVFGEQEVTSDR